MLKKFLLITGISFGVFIVSVVLHNALSALFGVEEAFFFVIAVFIAPAAFAVGAVGSIILAIARWRKSRGEGAE